MAPIRHTTPGTKPGTLVLAAVLALVAPAARAGDALRWGVIGASAADLATTQVAFATIPGARDANPMIGGAGSAVVVKAAATVGVLALDRHLEKNGHRKAAKVLKVAAIVAWGSCAAWNARQIAKRR